MPVTSESHLVVQTVVDLTVIHYFDAPGMEPQDMFSLSEG